MLKVFPFLVSLLFITSCGGVIDKYFLPVADDTVLEIFEAGNNAMQTKRYSHAIGYFSEIKDNYPFSPYVIESELSLGDALYLNGNFREASEAYQDFEELHPRHEAIPYVLVQIVRSLRQSYTSIDRETTELTVGIQYADRILSEYPGTDYALAAASEKAIMWRKMADRDVYIAQIYNKMGNYEASWNRYNKIAQTYTDLPEIVAYATEQGNVNYLRFRKNESEGVREERVGSWKELFEWL